jgi:hypothetical protein
MRGTQKRDEKNHVIVRVQKFNPGQIKYVRTLAVFFLFFFRPPLVVPLQVTGQALCRVTERSRTGFLVLVLLLQISRIASWILALMRLTR